MATYAIGDIQGCYSDLRALLRKVRFDAKHDRLWLAGDLVNRGPENLDTLRFIRDLGDSARVVLGNHDLHLLAHAHGVRPKNPKDTVEDVMAASDRKVLLDWLQHQPLLHYDREFDVAMVHAGIPPIWTIEEACKYAREVEEVLADPQDAARYFDNMYGNQPDCWRPDLAGPDRWRLITNYFTRMRFCSAAGQLELMTKSSPDDAPKGFAPWFSHNKHRWGDTTIIFGHWAALMGQTDSKQFIGLDTGCVWGGALTMVRLDDRQFFSVNCDGC